MQSLGPFISLSNSSNVSLDSENQNVVHTGLELMEVEGQEGDSAQVICRTFCWCYLSSHCLLNISNGVFSFV